MIGARLRQFRSVLPLSRLLWACVAAAVVVGQIGGRAQSSAAAPSVVAARGNAEQALLAGRYEDVDKFLAAHPHDDVLVALAGRALGARGEYARAQALLQPAAAAAPAGDSALQLGLLQIYLGRRGEGRRTLQLILLGESRDPSARELARIGRAARALGRFEDASSYFRDANAVAPNDAAINTEWGDLFVEKFNRKDAVASYQVALKSRPDYQPAIFGMARAVADENPPAARRYAQRALELNPNDVAAHLFIAELAIDEDQNQLAREAIARAQAINPHSLEAYALTAAVAYVDGEDDAYKQAIAAALKINPVYGEAYRVVGSVTARNYRFDEAVDQVRRGIAIDRDNPRSHADLGAHLMRTGDERNARRALETAFRLDGYDLITFNMLTLLDNLEQFQTITEGDLVIKLHGDEFGVLREYVPAIARDALASLSQRWNFTPKGPILIEVFPRHDDFAVRTLGLPGMIGALGACFGRVVTMDSPKARPPGEFNWGATLWHELAHVITLQLSAQRLPRWLSEGISEYEETRARPEWGRETEMAVPFVRALEDGEVLKLRDLNAGFQNPQMISMAYFQAALLVEHIAAKHGEPALRELVRSFADGIEMDEAIEKALGTDLDALQSTFDAFVNARFATLRTALDTPAGFSPDAPLDTLKIAAQAHPDSAAVQMALARALRKVDPPAAIPVFERAARLVPMLTGSESPYQQIVEVAMAAGDKAKAAEALAALLAVDDTAIESARQLVPLLDPQKDADRLRFALERVVAIDPFDAAAHTQLGRMALASGRAPEAVRLFRVALAAGPLDRAGAHADLAEGLLRTGDRAEAKKNAMAALEIAPTYERAQDLLLKLVEGQDR